MNWKSIIPSGIKINELSFDECRNFKQFYDILTQKITGPDGFRIFFKFLHHLLFYTLCCIEEEKFPALNKCWNDLNPLFGDAKFDNEWLFYCWLCCDFPLSSNSNRVVLDEFYDFTLMGPQLSDDYKMQLKQFYIEMKSSRLGLYQECSSTKKITNFKELFTKKNITTIRSVPYYETGEIFLTRIVSYLGDSFQIHNSQCYPAEYKDHVVNMVKNKLFYISDTGDQKIDYQKFMKIAGPYWMSCTHPDQDVNILSPDHYSIYYCNLSEHAL